MYALNVIVINVQRLLISLSRVSGCCSNAIKYRVTFDRALKVFPVYLGYNPLQMEEDMKPK